MKHLQWRYKVICMALLSYLGVMGIRTAASQISSYVGSYRVRKGIGEAFGREPGALRSFWPQRNVAISAVLSSVPQGEGNAAAFYQRLIAAIVGEGEEGMGGDLPAEGFSQIEHATQVARCSFLDIGKPELTRQEVDALVTAGKALVQKGVELEKAGETERAENVYEQVVVFGEHLRQATFDLVQDYLGQKISSAGVRKLHELAVSSGDLANVEALCLKRIEDQEEDAYIRRCISDLYGGSAESERGYVAAEYLAKHPSPVLRAEAVKALGYSLAKRICELEDLRSMPLLSFRLLLWGDLQGKNHTWWEERDLCAALRKAAEGDPEKRIRDLASEVLSNYRRDARQYELHAARIRTLPEMLFKNE